MALSEIIEPFTWGKGGRKRTPEELAREREVAEALMKQGIDFSPIASPLQGLARVATAAAGAYRNYQADKAEGEGRASAATDWQNAISGFGGGNSAAYDSPPSASGGRTPSDQPPQNIAGIGSPVSVQGEPTAPGDRSLGGSRSWRNNNPGNIEFGPFAKSMGATGSDGRFAIFPNYAAGRKAQEQLLFDSKGYRDLTLSQAVARWAPAFENNVGAYVSALTSGTGVGPDARMSDIPPDARAAILDAMQRHEGFRPGKGGHAPTRVASGDKSAWMMDDQGGEGLPDITAAPKGDYADARVNQAFGTQPGADPQTTGAVPPAQPSVAMPYTQGAPTMAPAQEDPLGPMIRALMGQSGGPVGPGPFPAAPGQFPAAPAAAPTRRLPPSAMWRGANQDIAAPGGGMSAAPTTGSIRAALAQANGLPSGGGGNFPAAPGGNGGNSYFQSLLQASGNQWMPEGQRAVINALLKQQFDRQSPEGQLDLQLKQAQLAKLQNAGFEPTDTMRNLEWRARQAGLQPGTPQYAQFMQGGGQGPQTVVNVGGNNSKFVEESDKAAAGRLNDIIASGNGAGQFMGDIQQLAALGAQIGTGKQAQVLAAIGPYAQALGVNIDGYGEAQAFDAIVSRLAPQMRPAGSGAASDFDARQFLNSLPKLGNSPDGNKIITDTFQAIQQNKIDAAEIASKALIPPDQGGITWQEAERQIRALPNPYERYRQFREGSGKSGVGGTTSSGIRWKVDGK